MDNQFEFASENNIVKITRMDGEVISFDLDTTEGKEKLAKGLIQIYKGGARTEPEGKANPSKALTILSNIKDSKREEIIQKIKSLDNSLDLSQVEIDQSSIVGEIFGTTSKGVTELPDGNYLIGPDAIKKHLNQPESRGLRETTVQKNFLFEGRTYNFDSEKDLNELAIRLSEIHKEDSKNEITVDNLKPGNALYILNNDITDKEIRSKLVEKMKALIK